MEKVATIFMALRTARLRSSVCRGRRSLILDRSRSVRGSPRGAARPSGSGKAGAGLDPVVWLYLAPFRLYFCCGFHSLRAAGAEPTPRRGVDGAGEVPLEDYPL